MLSKSQAKEVVKNYRNACSHLIGVKVVVQLGSHEFEMVVKDFQLAAVGQLSMTPEKVFNAETGKNATPQILQILFETGESINIVLDDISEFKVGVRGASFLIGQENLRILL